MKFFILLVFSSTGMLCVIIMNLLTFDELKSFIYIYPHVLGQIRENPDPNLDPDPDANMISSDLD